MLSALLEKYGRSLIDAGLVNLGETVSKVSFEVVIDLNGELNTVKKLDEYKKINNPVALYENGFSDSDGRNHSIPSLLLMKVGEYFDEENSAREIFIHNIEELIEINNNTKLKILCKFLKNNFLKLEQFGENPDYSSNMEFFIINASGEISPLIGDEDIVQDIRTYQDAKMKVGNGDGFICAINGAKRKYEIKIHSQSFAGKYKPRMITTTAYEAYYGKVPSEIKLKFSAESEMNINAAVMNIYKNKEKTHGDKIFFLGKMGELEPIHILEYEDRIIDQNDCHGLFYLEFSTINDARVSTYVARSYSDFEAKKIIANINKWNESCKGEKDEHLLQDAYHLIKGNNPYICERSEWDEKLTEYVRMILNGSFEELINKKYLPYYIRCEKQYYRNNLLKGVVKLANSEIRRDSVDFVAGQLLALATLIERRNRYLNKKDITITYAEEKLMFYRNDPITVWSDIRQYIEGYIQEDKTKIGRSLYRRMTELNYALIQDYSFSTCPMLNSMYLVGYDYEIEKYYVDLKKTEQNDEEITEEN